MLESAFNLVLRIHSRAATLTRLAAVGGTDEETNIRITPSNYFRKLTAVGEVTIAGREFVIAKASIVRPFTAPFVKIGDRISDSELGVLPIVEVHELYDLGGAILGYRVRTE